MARLLHQPVGRRSAAFEDRRRSRAQEMFGAAVRCRQAGRLAEAERCCRRVLALAPRHFESLHLLGILEYQLGHNEPAAGLIARAIAIHPNEPSYHCNLGIVLQAQGLAHDAVEHYQSALALRPEYAEAHFNCGNALQMLGRLGEAEDHYGEALNLRPGYAEAHMNLGNVLQVQGKLDEAMARYMQALALRPEYAEAHVNLGNLFQGFGRLDEAVEQYERALALQPERAETLVNLGRALEAKGMADAAVARYDEAIALRPENAEAHMNRALNQLRRGDFPSGLRGYEWRTRLERFAPRRNFSQPQWHGEELHGDCILLHCEQGLGDCLQFLRYAPRVAEVGGLVVLEVPESLRRLAERVEGVADVVSFGEVLPRFEWHCPLMSLPLAFGTTVDTIPASVPYLKAPKVERELAEGFRVGLVWAGNALHANDRNRSIALSALAPIFGVKGVHFHSLQVGKSTGQLGEIDVPVTDLAPLTHDMANTAALMMELDLVISVDTAPAHLAGALGRPLWVLLARDADWRWFTGREDSPWYPTARLFRQRRLGDWGEVAERVREALVELRNGKKTTAPLCVDDGAPVLSRNG